MRFLFFLLVFRVTAELSGQITLSGQVLNSAQEPIPFATIYIEDEHKGVSSNTDGFFLLHIQKLPTKIIVQSVGYQRKKIIIDSLKKSGKFNIQLEKEALKLDEITINAKRKDPAYAIVKKAISKKHHNSNYLNYPFKVNGYSKIIQVEHLKKPDSLNRLKRQTKFMETSSTLYYKNGAYKEHIFAQKKRGFANNKEAINVNFSHLNQSTFALEKKESDPTIFRDQISNEHLNFYKSYIQIKQLGPFKFLSPLANNSQLSYIFRLDEVFYQDGTPINKIEVIPRFRESNLFRGFIYIEEENWSIYKCVFSLKHTSIYYFNEFDIEVNFIKYDSLYIPHKETYNYSFKNGKNTLKGQTEIYFSDYIFNPPTQDDLFKKGQVLGYHSEAFLKDSLYWKTIRKKSLSQPEKIFVKKQDSVVAYHSSPEYYKKQDSIYNKLKFWDIPLNGVGFQNTFKRQNIYINPLISSFNFWGIGGFRLMSGGYASKFFKKNKGITIGPWLDYGPRNNDLKGFIWATYLFDPIKFKKISIKGGDVYDWVNPNESIRATLSGSNWLRKKTFGAEYSQETFNGVYLGAEIAVSSRSSIQGLDLPEWSSELLGDELNTPLAFKPWNETLLHIFARIVPGQKYYLEPNKKVIIENKYPLIELKFTYGIPNIINNSETNFSSLWMKINDQVEFPIFGTTKYRLHIGTFLHGDSNSTKFSNYQFFRGSDPYYYSNPLRSFQLLGPSISTRKSFMQATVAHHFEGLFFNKIPFLNKARLNEAVGGGILMIDQQNFIHTELYAGVEWPFKIKEQLFKIGGYFALGKSNTQPLQSGFKFGIDFFNLANKSWSY